MSAIPIVGKCFPTAKAFLAYLDALKFGTWRPRFVTMHHTGAPDLKTWQGWQTRAKPVSDEQWLKNLAKYYGDTMGWSSGPHFFFTPNNFCVLSPPTARGVHAVSFNATSWGVECVGDFDREKFDGPVREKYIEGLACLHIATGLALEPFERNVRGLHFHRDDPKTSKTCPGKGIPKPALIKAVQEKIIEMTGGAHVDEKPAATVTKKSLIGQVLEGGLNVRLDASQKAPAVKQLAKGIKVEIIGQKKNGTTLWYQIAEGFVSGLYIKIV